MNEFLMFTAVLLSATSCYLIITHIYAYLITNRLLRQFPGSTWLSSFTNIPLMWATASGRKFLQVRSAHEHLGPVVRVGSESLSFNDVTAFKEIYGHGSPVRKADFYDLQAGSHRHLVDSNDREEHSRKRRILAAAYSIAGLERWEHIVADRVMALVKQYDRLCLRPEYHPTMHGASSTTMADLDGCINHRHWMILFAQDAIAQIGLSADLKLVEAGHDILSFTDVTGKERKFSYREALWHSATIQGTFVCSPRWYKWLACLTRWHPYWRSGIDYTHMCVHLVQKRLARYQQGEKLHDFFSSIFEDKYGKPNLYPIGEMVAECSIMLNAGSDTTGIALTNVLYWLLKTPECYAKLRQELDTVLGDDDIVAPHDQIRHLPYLRACLDESLRLTPPNTLGVPRLTPPEGMSIMGHWIPGNRTVHCPPYTMHRNSDIFPEPDDYRPERWLAEGAKELQAHFVPFSGGSRACIGRNITYLEQTIVLATLLHRYDFELCKPDWQLSQREAITCSPGDMPVRISKRKVE